MSTTVLEKQAGVLSSAQRYQFETDGYVVVPDIFGPTDVARCRDALARLRREPDLAAVHAGKKRDEAHYVHFGPMLEYDPLFLQMMRNQVVLSIVRDLVGGDVRFSEMEAIINRRPDDADVQALRRRPWNVMRPGFHRGIKTDMNRRERDGYRHFNWVKALVLLTDVGPDDGGTLVIRGSQYSSMPKKEMLGVVEDQPNLVAQATGTAGSVLFLCESAIHSTSMILSDAERYMLVMGYAPTWAQCWRLHEPSADYLTALSAEDREFISGGERYE